MNKILMIVAVLFGFASGAETLGIQKDLTGQWRYTNTDTSDKKTLVTDLLVLKTTFKTGKDGNSDFYSVQSANQGSAPVLGLSIFKNSKGDLILSMRAGGKPENGESHIVHRYFSIKEQKKDLIVLGGTSTEGTGDKIEIIKTSAEAGKLERISGI